MKRSAMAFSIAMVLLLLSLCALATGESDAQISLWLEARIDTDTVTNEDGSSTETEVIALDLFMEATELPSGGDVFVYFPHELLDYNRFIKGESLNGTMTSIRELEPGLVRILFCSTRTIESGLLGTYTFVPLTPAEIWVEFLMEAGQFVGNDTYTLLTTSVSGLDYYYGENPPSTTPPTTEPATTTPPTTEPVTTTPPSTEPVTTTPPTTEPVTTTPPTTPPTTEPIETPTPPYTDDPDYETGDVNRDGRVDTGDAGMLLHYCVGLSELDAEQMALADFNNDGRVNTGDAAAILNYAVGL